MTPRPPTKSRFLIGGEYGSCYLIQHEYNPSCTIEANPMMMRNAFALAVTLVLPAQFAGYAVRFVHASGQTQACLLYTSRCV